jgi:hypothetical protein
LWELRITIVEWYLPQLKFENKIKVLEYLKLRFLWHWDIDDYNFYSEILENLLKNKTTN